jgi:hypothetical protein
MNSNVSFTIFCRNWKRMVTIMVSFRLFQIHPASYVTLRRPQRQMLQKNQSGKQRRRSETSTFITVSITMVREFFRFVLSFFPYLLILFIHAIQLLVKYVLHQRHPGGECLTKSTRMKQ